MDRQYAAFISYRHADLDSAVAKSLHSMIEQYRIPRELCEESNRLGIVFRDEEELHASSDLSHEITTALNNARHLIVVCSTNTAQSPWVTREIETFLKNHDRSQIFTVLASGEPQDVFPRRLTHIVDEADGSVQVVEPLAVDVRADSFSAMRRKLRRELPRLISSMLGLPYDVLVMREQKRKTRRILAASAAAMAVVLSFSSMVLLKNREIQQRNEEIEYQNQEIQQRNEEIEHQNRELARQKAEVQLRESQLLTQNAREALASGDYRTAIENATAALPEPGGDNRPYYAPAEACLMDAMNVFGIGESPVVLTTRKLSQMTPIHIFRIAEDGSRLVTMDEYGGVRCFSTDAGKLLWTATVTGVSNSQQENLMILPDKVLCFYQSRVEAFDLETGASLWQWTMDECIEGYMFYQPERDTLLLMEGVPSGNYSYDYQVLTLNASTGEKQQSISIAPLDDTSADFIGPYYTEYYLTAGAFSEDGTRFAGACFDNDHKLHCFTVNLETGTGRELYRHNTPGYYAFNITSLTFRDSELLLTVHNLKQNAASVLNIDSASGKLLWKKDIFGKENTSSYLADTSHVIIGTEQILLGFHDLLYLVDAQSGDILAEKTLPGVITELRLLPDRNFGYCVDSGICGIGFIKKDDVIHISSERSLNVYTTVLEHKALQIWGGGIVQYYSDGVSAELSISNHAFPGFVALIPAEANQEIHVLQPVRISTAVSRSELTFPNLTLRPDSGSGCSVRASADRLILGPMRTVENFNTTYVILDRETMQPLYHWTTQEYVSSSRICWLPDTYTRLTDDGSGNVSLTDLNGRTTVLASNEDRIIKIDGTWYFTTNLLRSDSVYQTEGDHVLSAATTLERLSVWLDGEVIRSLPLPDDLRCAPKSYGNYTRHLRVSPTGYVLVTLHPDPGTLTTDCVMVYNTARGTWQRLPGEHPLPNTRAMVFSDKSPLLAVVDGSEMLRLYDLSDDARERVFPAGIPADSVSQMTFLMDDSCLAVLSEDGKLLIYDLSDGTILYRDQLAKSYSGALRTYVDSAKNRLYISTGEFSYENDALCIDLGSWERLGYVQALIWFDEETGLLYQYNRNYSAPAIYYATVPSTEELVKLAQETQ